jgi:hypothetical protein
MFLWHFPSSRPDRTLSCTMPCEARTFLTHSGAVIQRTPHRSIPWPENRADYEGGGTTTHCDKVIVESACTSASVQVGAPLLSFVATSEL